MHFNNVRLLVLEFDDCFKFYRDTLGLECVHGNIGEAFASFKIGHQNILGLFRASLMAEAVNNKSAFYRRDGIDNFAIILQVDNLEEKFVELQNKGVNFITPPTDMPAWGIKIAHFRDPENNLFEIFSFL